jgi:putative flippase GtrA
MTSAPSATAPKARQTAAQRLCWFLVGAVVNYLLIASPFKYLSANTELPIWAKSALSIGVSTTFFFFWNYFVNFRTDSRKRDAFARYVTAVIVLWAISTTILTLFKKFDAKMSFLIFGHELDLDVVATQACFGWLKFIVYHKWAFPAAKPEPLPSGPASDG